MPGSYGSASGPAELPGRLLHRGRGARPEPERRVDQRLHQRRSTSATRRLHGTGQLLALAVEPHDRRRRAPARSTGCYTGEFWAVSQAAPMRRVEVTERPHVRSWTTAPARRTPAAASSPTRARRPRWSAARSSSSSSATARSAAGRNGVWNQVFSGTTGAPAAGLHRHGRRADRTRRCRPPRSAGRSRTSTSTARAAGRSSCPTPRRTPPVRRGRHRPTPRAARSRCRSSTSPSPATRRRRQHGAGPGQNLLLTPGVYALDRTIKVWRAGHRGARPRPRDADLRDRGADRAQVADVAGVDIAGLIFDAGPSYRSALLQVGRSARTGATRPAVRTRPRCRTCSSGSAARTPAGRPPAWSSTATTWSSTTSGPGGPTTAPAWAGRQHRRRPGWSSTVTDVTATGLFVEHFQQYETVWNGEAARMVFFQNEMPYDVPNQAAWMSGPGTQGYAAFKVGRPCAGLPRLRHGHLQLLQPGRRHLRRARLRGAGRGPGSSCTTC